MVENDENDENDVEVAVQSNALQPMLARNSRIELPAGKDWP